MCFKGGLETNPIRFVFRYSVELGFFGEGVIAALQYPPHTEYG